MPKRCSLYWSRHAVSYSSNAYLGGAEAPAATTLHPVLHWAWPVPAAMSPSQSLPCSINQRLEPCMTESCGWGGGITKTKIEDHLLLHVCQLSQLKKQEEKKAWQEERQLFFFPFPSCSKCVPSLSSNSFASYIPDKDTQTDTQFLLKDFGLEIFRLET